MCYISNDGGEGECQFENSVDNCSQQVELSEGVRVVGSEVAHRPAKGTEYRASTSTRRMLRSTPETLIVSLDVSLRSPITA